MERCLKTNMAGVMLHQASPATTGHVVMLSTRARVVLKQT